MSNIDTLRRQVEEARSEIVASFTMAAHIETLLTAHRALVVKELATQTDTETLKRAADILRDITEDYQPLTYLEVIQLLALPLTAPLAAKYEQLEDRYAEVTTARIASENRVASLESALRTVRVMLEYADSDMRPSELLGVVSSALDALGGPV